MRRAYKIATVALISLRAARADAALPASDAIPYILSLLFVLVLLGGFLLIIWYRYSRALRSQREEHRRAILQRSRDRHISGKWAPTTVRETKVHDLEKQKEFGAKPLDRERDRSEKERA